MPRAARTRISRAEVHEATATGGALDTLAAAMPQLMESWIALAPTNPQVASILAKLAEDDLYKARQGKNELLDNLTRLRAAGSQIQKDLWARAARQLYNKDLLDLNDVEPVVIHKRQWYQAGDGSLPNTLPKIPDS